MWRGVVDGSLILMVDLVSDGRLILIVDDW